MKTKSKKTIGILLATFLLVVNTYAQVKIGGESQVNTYSNNDQFEVQLDHDDAGNFVTVWVSDGQLSNGKDIFGQRFDASGNKVGQQFQVNSTVLDDQEFPDVAVDPAGNFVVVWASKNQDGSDYGVYFQRFDNSGNKLGGEVPVNTTTLALQSLPNISMNSSGNFAISWISFLGSSFSDQVMVRTFNSSGIATSLETLVYSAGAGIFVRTDVAIDTRGNIAVVYHDNGMNGLDCFLHTFDSLVQPIQSRIKINTYDSVSQDFPVIAMNPAGEFIVAWISGDQDGSSSGIFAQQFTASGTPIGTEIFVNQDYTFSTQTDVDVSMDSLGNFVIVWKSWGFDGDNYGVVAKKYLANGTSTAQEFQVNTTIIKEQRHPGVSMQKNGAFVIAWESVDQDSSGSGIFMQRYSASVPLSFEGNELECSFLLYPNPVKDKLSIEFEKNEKCMISIYNLKGQVIFSEFKIGRNKTTTLDLSSLNRGIYIVKIKTQQSISSYKIVKE